MERWLTQRLSGRLGASPGRADGICANVSFPSPRALVDAAVATAAGLDPEEDPWRPERAVWPLLEVVEAGLGEPWLHALAVHLGAAPEAPDPERRARRLTTVRHLANLFDRYALHRPDMVRGWAHEDGPAPPPAHAWQAELWRRLRARIGEPDPAERLEGACARLREDPGLIDLPERLALFGLTRLPAAHGRVLRALARHRDVHLLLLHPSPALWDRVAARLDAPVVRRRTDPTSGLAASRLLASWGQDARELQLVLDPQAGDAVHHHPVAHATGTLLARIQAGVREDDPPPGAPLDGEPDARPPLDRADRSVEVHACHGRARQVEVLRDAILHLLAGDPSLEPRDVIVMCPDIETFAPLIQATFGAGEGGAEEDEASRLEPGDRPPDLRVRLADRSLRQTNPVLGVVGRLLELPEQRVTASQVLDLAGREPVRRRFGLDDEDLTRLEEWVSAAGIRWGLDASQRAPFGLAELAANTWRAGLDRLLVGVTMTADEHRLVDGVLPLDDVESGAIDLAGRFAELVARLGEALEALAAPKRIDVWAAALGDAADALTATTERDAWQRTELGRILDALVAEATASGAVASTPIALPELRAGLAERLRGRPTRANFRTGHLTICTLQPMRSVPHRVVCLLGLDDGVFPRRSARDGDDLILDDPHVGDRDGRAEDRQMLLDAVLAARDRLIVTYAGKDERTNTPRPPAVPVGELLDVVDATVRTPEGRAREAIVVEHPLQPFDPRNFDPGRLVADRPWSFDRVTLAGARALEGERHAPGAFLGAPLPPLADAALELEDLVRFAEHPVRAFLRRRLGIRLGDVEEEVEDGLPVELDPLERWAVGRRLLEARLAGAPAQAAYRAEIARGALPPGPLAEPVVRELLGQVEPIVDAVGALAPAAGDPASADVRVRLPDGRLVTGTVPGVTGDVVRTILFSRVAPKHRLAAWVRLLALAASDPERPYEALTIGRARRSGAAAVTVARIAPPGPSAIRHLAAFADLYDRGMREVPPIACATSAAYAQAARTGGDPIRAARGAWTSAFRFSGEDAELEHRLVLGGTAGLEVLLATPPGSDEAGQGWDAGDPTRFGRHARRLWAGLLDAERLEDR